MQRRSRSPRRPQGFVAPTRTAPTAADVGTVPKCATKVRPARTNFMPSAAEANNSSLGPPAPKPEDWKAKIKSVLEQQEEQDLTYHRLQALWEQAIKENELLIKKMDAQNERIEALEKQLPGLRTSSHGQSREAESTSSTPAVVPPPHPGPSLRSSASPHLDNAWLCQYFAGHGA